MIKGNIQSAITGGQSINVRLIILTAFLAFSSVLLMTGCGKKTEPEKTGKIKAFVDIPPQAFFVEQIGGEFVEVSVLVQPGSSPHTFEPSPRQISDLSRSDVFFMIGLPFENKIVEKVTGKDTRLRVVRTDAGVKKRAMDEQSNHDHHHEYEHEASDPHIWLGPQQIKVQATNIAATLSEIDPEHAANFQENLAAFTSRLDRVNRIIKHDLKPFRGEAFYVYHPSFGYFADAFGLVQYAVETGGKSPSPRTLAQLAARAKSDNVRVIFVQPQFAGESAQVIANAINGQVISIDPLAKDVFANLSDMSTRIAAALSEKENPR